MWKFWWWLLLEGGPTQIIVGGFGLFLCKEIMIWKQGWKSYKQNQANQWHKVVPKLGVPKISHFPTQNQEWLGGCLLAFAQDLSSFATTVAVVCDPGHGKQELLLLIAWGKVSLSFFWWKNIASSKCRKKTQVVPINKQGWKNSQLHP